MYRPVDAKLSPILLVQSKVHADMDNTVILPFDKNKDPIDLPKPFLGENKLILRQRLLHGEDNIRAE